LSFLRIKELVDKIKALQTKRKREEEVYNKKCVLLYKFNIRPQRQTTSISAVVLD
jgi:hypothetical protein